MIARTTGLAAGLLLTTALTAQAAGIERTGPSTRVLFEEGRYAEFSLAYVMPDLEGEGGAIPPTLPGGPGLITGSTNDLLDSYFTFGAAYKADINDQLSYALILSNPWGVDTDYGTGSGTPYDGVAATLDSVELTALLAYDVTDRIKIYGGPRFQMMEAEADIAFLGYSVDADRDFGIGYALGASYSIPDIAFRVALTYYSEIDHTHDTAETVGPGSFDTETDITTPQSVNLEFQTGIAEDTLVFGSIRWVDWSSFSIEPPNYPLGTLVDYEEDWTTYTLGIGRRLNENWSAFAQVSWEPQSDTVLTTLGPVDGRRSIGIGATYRQDNVSITGGLTYVDLGDAENLLTTEYEGGSAIAAGIRVGFNL